MAKSPAKKPAEPPAKPEAGLRVFGNKPFMRFARKFGATDKDLWEVLQEEPDADLGGGVYKFRLARESEGSSGGARSIVAMKRHERIVMMYAFEKKNSPNINSKGLKAFKRLAKIYLERSDEEMEKLVKIGEMLEIKAPPAQEPQRQIRSVKQDSSH